MHRGRRDGRVAAAGRDILVVSEPSAAGAGGVGPTVDDVPSHDQRQCLVAAVSGFRPLRPWVDALPVPRIISASGLAPALESPQGEALLDHRMPRIPHAVSSIVVRPTAPGGCLAFSQPPRRRPGVQPLPGVVSWCAAAAGAGNHPRVDGDGCWAGRAWPREGSGGQRS